MKTFLHLLTALAIASLVIVGCTDTSDPILAPTEQIPSADPGGAMAKCGPVLHFATALAQTRVNVNGMADPNGKGLLAAEIGVYGYANDKCNGVLRCDWVGNFEPFMLKAVEGRVVQLRVTNNKAKLMFEVTKGSLQNGTSLTGQVGCLVLIDNGVGQSGAPVDYISAFAIDTPETMKQYGFWEMSADDFLAAAAGAGFPEQPISSGDIKVK